MSASCHIRFGLPSLAVIVSLAGGTSQAEPTFPYSLNTPAGGVEVRSGPGLQFYATGRLEADTDIEVYRHDKGGWLGIRPPLGSFSWVRRNQLEPTARPGVTRVLEDDTVCRVGSQVAEVPEHTGQVYLEKNEFVQMLTDSFAESETSRQLEKDGWCRIAPPAGEFRWVRARDVAAANAPTRTRPLAAARDQTPSSDSAPPPANQRSPVQLTADWQEPSPRPGELSTAAVMQAVALQAVKEEPSATSAEAAGPNADRTGEKSTAADSGSPADQPAEVTNAQADSVLLQPPRAVDEGEQKQDVATGFAERPADPDAGVDPSRWVPRGQLSDDELLDIELRLSVMASRDIRTWQLQPLRDRVETMLPRLREHTGRPEAEQLLARIAEFERLQRRFGTTKPVEPLAGGSADSTATGAVAPPGWSDSPIGRFDGSGWLVPVYSTRRVAPPYALLDAEGEVLQYVSPSPGLNLHRYLKKQVGIHGQRGYAPTLNKPLLTAERVVDLSRHLR